MPCYTELPCLPLELTMRHVGPFQRLSGLLAVVAGPTAWASLLVGLSVVNFNFEQFSDPRSILALESTAVPLLRWSFFLSMFGSYLLLIPLAICLGSILGSPGDPTVRFYTFCGLIYLVLGAVGAAILAAVWPSLITLAGRTSSQEEGTILIAFTTATQIAEDGLQGVVQNLAGGIWLAGSGSLLWQKRRILSGFTIALGVILLVNTLGNLIEYEALSLIGLTATILLVPVWSVCAGLVVASSPSDR